MYKNTTTKTPEQIDLKNMQYSQKWRLLKVADKEGMVVTDWCH
jgi:hypothetical protein